MSQLDSAGTDALGPTGQLPRGLRPDEVRRATGERVPRQGIVDRLQTPGVAILPPAEDTMALQMAEGLQRALGLTAQITNQLGNEAQAAKAKADAEQRRLAENEAVQTHKTEVLEQAQASQDALTDYQTFKDDLLTGKKTLDPGADPTKVADNFINEQTSGRSMAYAMKYAQIKDNLVAEMLTTRRMDTAKRQSELLGVLANGATGIKSTDEANSYIEQAKTINPKLSDAEAKATVLLPGAKAAAEAGNATQLQVFKDALGPDFTLEAAKLDQMLGQAQNRQQAQKDRVFSQQMATLQFSGAPPVLKRMMVDQFQGIADPTVLETAKHAIDTEEAGAAKKILADAYKQMKLNAVPFMANQIAPAMLGGSPFGSSIFPKKITIPSPDPDKPDIEVDRSAAEAMVYQNFKQTVVAPMGADTFEGVAASMKFFSLNPDSKDPQWAAETADPMQRITKDTTPDNFPPALMVGWSRYKSMMSQSPEIAARHMSQKDQTYWRWVDGVVSGARGETPQSAMIAVAKATQHDPTSIDAGRLKFDADMKAAGDAFGKGHDNAEALSSELASRANVYNKIFGVPRDQAITRAKTEMAEDYVDVNGLMVNRRGKATPDNIGSVGPAVVGAYKAEHPLEADQNLKMGMDRFGNWGIVDAQRPSILLSESPVFAEDDIARVSRYVNDRNAEDKQAEANKRFFDAQMAAHNMSGKLTTLQSAANWWARKINQPEQQTPAPFVPEPTLAKVPETPQPTDRMTPHLKAVFDWIDARRNERDRPAFAPTPRQEAEDRRLARPRFGGLE